MDKRALIKYPIDCQCGTRFTSSATLDFFHVPFEHSLKSAQLIHARCPFCLSIVWTGIWTDRDVINAPTCTPELNVNAAGMTEASLSSNLPPSDALGPASSSEDYKNE